MNNNQFQSANLKIKRACNLISEISKIIVDQPPYTYVLETNTKTSERATFAKTNQYSLDNIVILCGDVLHNLSSALDHAYWEAVSPVVSKDKHRNIQFPFAKDSTKIEEIMKKKFAHLVNIDFYNAILGFKSYAGNGGNILLNLIHDTNIEDKHKTLIPVGDFTEVTSKVLKRQIPDFPQISGSFGFGQNRRDIAWSSTQFKLSDIDEAIPPFTYLFHKTLNVPVNLVFIMNEQGSTEPIIKTLLDMVNEVEKTLKIMKSTL